MKRANKTSWVAKTMSRNRSAEEVKDNFIATFPNGAGELAYELWNSIANLHLVWKNYRSLYGTSRKRVDLLYWAAASHFGMIERVLRHNVVLAIARLTDPPRSAGKSNASLAQLLIKIENCIDSNLATELKSDLMDLQNFCENIRQIRNRILAHGDLDTVLHTHSEPIEGISRAYIEEILEKLRIFYGKIEYQFQGSRTEFGEVLSTSSSERLLSVLAKAKEYDDHLKQERDRKLGLA